MWNDQASKRIPGVGKCKFCFKTIRQICKYIDGLVPIKALPWHRRHTLSNQMETLFCLEVSLPPFQFEKIAHFVILARGFSDTAVNAGLSTRCESKTCKKNQKHAKKNQHAPYLSVRLCCRACSVRFG